MCFFFCFGDKWFQQKRVDDLTVSLILLLGMGSSPNRKQQRSIDRGKEKVAKRKKTLASVGNKHIIQQRKKMERFQNIQKSLLVEQGLDDDTLLRLTQDFSGKGCCSRDCLKSLHAQHDGRPDWTQGSIFDYCRTK